MTSTYQILDEDGDVGNNQEEEIDERQNGFINIHEHGLT